VGNNLSPLDAKSLLQTIFEGLSHFLFLLKFFLRKYRTLGPTPQGGMTDGLPIRAEGDSYYPHIAYPSTQNTSQSSKVCLNNSNPSINVNCETNLTADRRKGE
jgi:hypothetical protein